MHSRRTIPIVADTYVDREFGTGALKITPGHDPNDFEIGQRLGLPIINVMNNDGTFNGNAGRFDGVERSEVRKQLWADLKVGLSFPSNRNCHAGNGATAEQSRMLGTSAPSSQDLLCSNVVSCEP